MSKKKRAVFIVVWAALMVIVLVAALLVGGSGESESIKVVMRDAVLHGTNKVSLFGIKDVNPAYISSLIVCGALLVFAAVIRIFVIKSNYMKYEVHKYTLTYDLEFRGTCTENGIDKMYYGKTIAEEKIEYEMYDENGNLISSSSSTIDSGYKYFAIRNE